MQMTVPGKLQRIAGQAADGNRSADLLRQRKAYPVNQFYEGFLRRIMLYPAGNDIIHADQAGHRLIYRPAHELFRGRVLHDTAPHHGDNPFGEVHDIGKMMADEEHRDSPHFRHVPYFLD